MKVLLSHITGNPNSREAALALAEREWLSELHTTLCWKPSSWLDRWLPERWTKMLRRRAFPSEVLKCVRTHGMDEIVRLLVRDSPLPAARRWLAALLVARPNNLVFDAAVARSIKKGTECDAVYGYIDASLLTFRAAKARGLRCLYEIPTLYWRAKQHLLREETVNEPLWAMTLPSECENHAEQAQRDEELQLADVVVVPSEFVRQSLTEAPAFKGHVVVVPYGSPPEAIQGEERSTSQGDKQSSQGSALRVLFVGNLGQAKGLSYLAKAMGLLVPGTVELTLVGRRVTEQRCEPLEKLLREHQHIDGLPNAEVLELMAQYDVLVLPTLFEGMSLTVLEAMSQGLVVLTTIHSGYQGVMTDGREGFIIPIRDANAIADRLNYLAKHRAELATMKIAARALAKDLSAARYRAAVAAVVSQSLTGASL
jgi:alpha-maltose-1-phosphate synthase